MTNGNKSYTQNVENFYEQIEKMNGRIDNQNATLSNMELRIVNAINDVKLTIAPLPGRIESNKKDLEKVENKVNTIGVINGALAGIATVIGSIFGGK